jgi:hypothetical protein
MLTLSVAVSLAGGCAPKEKKEPEQSASSLVYSPAARISNDRADRASPDAATSQEDPVRPPAGHRCRVHLRREALGVAGQAPYPLTGNNLATDRAQITGTLERVGKDWLVVRGDRSTYWVPREAVLAVEFADQ